MPSKRDAASLLPPVAAIAYDRGRGRVIARVDLAAGTPLGRLVLPVEPAIQAGDTLALTSAVGLVQVRRAVKAMQAGRYGRRVFVKDAEDHVFSVPVGAAR